MSDIEWRTIPGWEGFYEVSNDGQVRSLERVNRRGIAVPSRILKLSMTVRGGYPRVSLCDAGKKSYKTVHRLVMMTFVGECPEGLEVLHGDGDPTNNRLSNLSYDTHAENTRDTVRHGRHPSAGSTHCKRGHPFSEENTYLTSTQRVCRTCRRASLAAFRERRRATVHATHRELAVMSA